MKKSVIGLMLCLLVVSAGALTAMPVVNVTECGQDLNESAYYRVVNDLTVDDGDCLTLSEGARGSILSCIDTSINGNKEGVSGLGAGTGITINADWVVIKACTFTGFENQILVTEGVSGARVFGNTFFNEQLNTSSVKVDTAIRFEATGNYIFNLGNPYHRAFYVIDTLGATVIDNWSPFSDLRVINSTGAAFLGHYQRVWLTNSPLFYLFGVSYLELIID